MIRRLFFSFLILSLVAVPLASPVMAGSLFPRIRMPNINVTRGVRALTYPVTKSLINGGKDVLKVGAAADSVGLVPNIGPAPVSKIVKKTLWGIGRH